VTHGPLPRHLGVSNAAHNRDAFANLSCRKVRNGSRTAVAGRLVAQPVYPQLQKSPSVLALTLRTNNRRSAAPIRNGGVHPPVFRWEPT
jgi:hypothetical protein